MQRILTYNVDSMSTVDTVIECNITDGIGIHVGLADTTTKEILLRVATAIQSCNYRIPGKKIVINILPSLTTGTPALDLPIALAILIASGQVKPSGMEGDNLDLKMAAVGELALDGNLRPVRGTVSMVQKALTHGIEHILIPMDNKSKETDLIWHDDAIIGIRNLRDAVKFIEKGDVPTQETFTENNPQTKPYNASPLDIRTMTLAAAGGHGLILMGQTGRRKKSLAETISSLLPENKVENAKLRSICGMPAGTGNPFVTVSLPMTITQIAGSFREPGLMTRSDRGVLLLDDINHISASLRIPIHNILKDKTVTISSVRGKKVYPANTLPVLDFRPCPCGRYGHTDDCTCSERERKEHVKRLKDDILYGHFDLQHWTLPDNHKAVSIPVDEAAVMEMREIVSLARAAQKKRFKNTSIRCNAEMNRQQTEAFCRLSPENESFLREEMRRCAMSMNRRWRILKIARTISDVDEKEDITLDALSEAISYRFIDAE